MHSQTLSVVELDIDDKNTPRTCQWREYSLAMTRVTGKFPSTWSTGLPRVENEMLLAGNELSTSTSHGHFHLAKSRNCSHVEIRRKKEMQVE